MLSAGRSRVLGGLFFFLAVFFLASDAHYSGQTRLRPGLLPADLQEGDVILRRGSGLLSLFISERLGESEEFTHAGIVVKQSGQWLVIHSLPESISGFDGVQAEPLAVFLAASEKAAFFRARLPAEARSRAAARAWQFLRQKIAFDFSFDWQDQARFYCSELLWACYVGLFDRPFRPAISHTGRLAVLSFGNFSSNPAYFAALGPVLLSP